VKQFFKQTKEKDLLAGSSKHFWAPDWFADRINSVLPLFF